MTQRKQTGSLGHPKSSTEGELAKLPKELDTSPISKTPKRLSISLSGDAAKMLEWLAENQGVTQNEALRKAIATETYFRQELEAGTKVLLEKANKDIREVVFR